MQIRLAAVLLAGLASVAHAQADSARPPKECLSARPKPRCDRIWITEAELAFPIAGAPSRHPFATWELGYMVNRDHKPALGVSGFFQWNDNTSAGLGIRPRARWWLGERTSVDVGPGVFTDYQGTPTVGANLLLALNTRVIALTTTSIWAHEARSDGRKHEVRYQTLGLRAGGFWGVALAMLAIIVLAALFFTLGD